MKNEELVNYHGTQVVSWWVEKIEAAQKYPKYAINGTEFERVRYGSESVSYGAEERSCHDCAVVAGSYHVPSCDVEECPNCHEQAISCGCDYSAETSEIQAERLHVKKFRERKPLSFWDKLMGKK